MNAPFGYLTIEQIDKLQNVLTQQISIHPSPSITSCPQLQITPKNFLQKILLKLKENSIDIASVRLYGGAASHVLANKNEFLYRDIDILFFVKTPLTSQVQTLLFSSNNQPCIHDVWTLIKCIVSLCLVEESLNTEKNKQSFLLSIIDAYTKKNIQINYEQDSWALLSLQNPFGINIELKFIENLKRQWQFSVDSFQIDIQPILEQSVIISESIPTPTPFNNSLIPAMSNLNITAEHRIIANQTQNRNTNPFEVFSPSITASKTIQHRNNEENESHLCLSEENLNGNQSANHSATRRGSSDDADDGIDVDYSTNEDEEHENSIKSEKISNHLLLIQYYSSYKDLQEALNHLNQKKIATYEPETVRGGGLLKYCDLLARDYRPYDEQIMYNMQRYMCSRFFIDYKTLLEQIRVISQYVTTHFLPLSEFNDISNIYINRPNETIRYALYPQHQIVLSNTTTNHVITFAQNDAIYARICYKFFEYLKVIIGESTVCLTNADTIPLFREIHNLRNQYLSQYYYAIYNDPEIRYHYFLLCHHSLVKHSLSNENQSTLSPNLTSNSHKHDRGHASRNNYYSKNHQNHYARNNGNRYVTRRQNQS